MIHLSLNIDVTFLLERYFSDDIELDLSHEQFASFCMGSRIEVRMYHDFPMYLSVFFVDGEPVLKENFVDGSVADYIEKTQTQNFLSDFLIQYAEAKREC